MSMRIDLTFHGKYTSVWALQQAVRGSEKARVVYMARSDDIEAVYAKFGRTLPAAKEKRDRCDVAYIGITSAADLGSRFGSPDGRQHHKVGDSTMAGKGLPSLTEFWAGYFRRPAEAAEDGGRHEWRLLLAEDILIAWFLPPLNTSGVQRSKAREGTGSGSFMSASVHLHWATASGKQRSTSPPGPFPKSLHYNHSAVDDASRLVAYF
ncbi:MAG: hypothetical protein AAF566_02785 [Pseudomonadota bacterium]